MNILHIAFSMQKVAADKQRISFLHKVANGKQNPLMWFLDAMMNPTTATPPDPNAPNPYSWDRLAKIYKGYQTTGTNPSHNPYQHYEDQYKMSDPEWSASANQTSDVIHRRVSALKAPSNHPNTTKTPPAGR